MANAFKLLSKIDRKIKYSVYGWIREAEKELKLAHIPTMLSSICILFCNDFDVFESMGCNLKAIKWNTCAIAEKEYPRYSELGAYDRSKCDIKSNICYGKNQISSTSNKIFEWKFRFTTTSSTWCQIGIISDHGFVYDFEILRPIGKQYVDIKMLLNSKTMNLKYATNHSSYHGQNSSTVRWLVREDEIFYDGFHRYRSIKGKKRDGTNIKYKVKVIVFGKGDSVEILNFAQKDLA